MIKQKDFIEIDEFKDLLGRHHTSSKQQFKRREDEDKRPVFYYHSITINVKMNKLFCEEYEYIIIHYRSCQNI